VAAFNIERENVRVPMLIRKVEDPNVGYSLKYKGEFSQLCSIIEKSLDQEVSKAGKTVVLVS